MRRLQDSRVPPAMPAQQVSVCAGVATSGGPCDGWRCDDLSGSLRTLVRRGLHASFRLGTGLQTCPHIPPRFRLAVIVPWYNDTARNVSASTSLPASWPYWLASAATNAAIADFLLVHDPSVSPAIFGELPSNVKSTVVPDLQGAFREVLRDTARGNGGSNKLDGRKPANMAMQDARARLKDVDSQCIKGFKPLLGHAFAGLLVPYSHWAFGDVDVVYGDLRRFLTPSVLQRDVVSFRQPNLCSRTSRTVWAGQLTVFRNNAWARLLYRSVSGWREQLGRCSSGSSFFDERYMPRNVLATQPTSVSLIASQLADSSIWVRRHWGFSNATRSAPPYRQLIWAVGRLVVVEIGGTQCRRSRHCASTEAALVHLDAFKKAAFADGRTVPFDGAGFAYTSVQGVRPLMTLVRAATEDIVAADAVRAIHALRNGELLSCPTFCSKVQDQTIQHRSDINGSVKPIRCFRCDARPDRMSACPPRAQAQ